MGVRRTSYSITGVADSTVHSSVFQSTVAQPAKVLAVEVAVSAYNASTLEMWIDQDRYQDIDVRNLRSHGIATADSGSNQNPITRLEVDKELEVGQQFTVAVNSGATLCSAVGAIVWEDLGESR
jgi:hypothetical protein